MAKVEIKENHKVKQIFDDLENFLNFCKEFGYVFDEKELYSNKSYVYRQYLKFESGKQVKDNWVLDNKLA